MRRGEVSLANMNDGRGFFFQCDEVDSKNCVGVERKGVLVNSVFFSVFFFFFLIFNIS